MINPLNEKQRTRLIRHVQWSRAQLGQVRINRFTAVQDMVGSHYTENGSDTDQPVNMICLGMIVYTRQIVARTPRALYTSPYPEQKTLCAHMKLALDQEAKRLQMRDLFRRCILDGMFGRAQVKIGIDEGVGVPAPDGSGRTIQVGRGFADDISFDDWVHDMSVKRWPQRVYEGHVYRVPLQWAKDNTLFRKEARADLTVSEPTTTTEKGQEKASAISQGHTGAEEDVQDMVDLLDLYLPQENIVITCSVDETFEVGALLNHFAWEGPPTGPYRGLGFQEVPDQTLPLPPVAMWRDLHTLGNDLWNKLAKDARREKTVTGYRGESAKDAQRVVDANGGDTIAMDNPEGVREFHYGGIKPETLVFALQVRNQLEYMMGNLGMLGGLAAQSETLGQDQMLQAQTSKLLADMQDRATDFMRDVMHDVGFWLYGDPLRVYNVTTKLRSVPGVQVTSRFTPEQRQTAQYYDQNMDIEVHSMQHKTPEERLRILDMLIKGTFAPLAPMMEAQGVALNIPELVKLFSEYTHMPELLDILELTGGSNPYPPGPLGERPRQAPVTNRINTRVNTGGGAKGVNRDQEIMDMLMSGAGRQNAMAGVA